MLHVIKRNGKIVPFDKEKIRIAIEKAMKSPAGNYIKGQAERIAADIEQKIKEKDLSTVSIHDIESAVYDLLVKYGNSITAKSYEAYRAVHEFQRMHNTSDDNIMNVVRNSDIDLRDDNSNKNTELNSTKRDMIAGEVSKDILKRKLMPKELVEAWEDNIFWFHDADYAIADMFNCCLPNLEDMLANGTVINGRKIDPPKSFQVACTVMTQIIACIASNQYGGQSINGVDRILAPYVRKSYNRHYAYLKESDPTLSDKECTKLAKVLTKREVKDGVQTIQYQINTLMTTNGQTPFVTLFLYFKPDYEYAEEAAMICEEILRQRYQGIKNKDGVYTTPVFPKLIYALDEHNIHEDSPYYYLTKLAVATTARRQYPDYVSAKILRENYGDCFGPMGCRSFLSPWKDPKSGKLKWEGRFNAGVVTLNLPQIALIAKGDMDVFNKLLEARLELCKQALLWRHDKLLGVTSDVSPLHWQFGGIARLKPGEKIDPYLYDGYSTLSLGYIGVYETTILMTGESNSTEKGHRFALSLVQTLRDHCDAWKEEYNIGFSLYSTPAEKTCYTLCERDKKIFGDVKDVTDKGYYTNSYHCDVRENMSWKQKWELEAPFQKIASGGCISYVEIPNMQQNEDALLQMIQYLYEHLQYGEFNTKTDYCGQCGFQGEIKLNKDLQWECPICGNINRDSMEVVRRTCGK